MSDEEAAYRDLIAGSSSDDELSENEDDLDNDDDDKGSKQGSAAQAKLKELKRIEEMRLKLLGGLSASSKDKPVKKGEVSGGFEAESDDPMSDGAREELQVNFGVGFGEDIGKKLI